MGIIMSTNIIDTLYLGSQSRSRQRLLKEANIPFIVLDHKSDEEAIARDPDFKQYVTAIAKSKIEALDLPHPADIKTDYIFVLTADTLIRTIANDQILAKPVSLEHAKDMLQRISAGPIDVQTGCCLRRYKKTGTNWQIEKEIQWASGATIEYVQEPEEFDAYVKQFPFVLSITGGCIAEEYGQNFFKSINGSLTAVYGLPVFELRQELKKLNFIFKN
jgi:septum formation protein